MGAASAHENVKGGGDVTASQHSLLFHRLTEMMEGVGGGGKEINK